MQMSLYQLLQLTAAEAGLLPLLQAGQQAVTVFLALLALCTCFAGFKLYRPIASAVMLLAVILGGFHWLCPAWGMLKGVTFCAVVSCSLAVVTFLAFHFGALFFSFSVAAGYMFMAFRGFQLPLWGMLLIMAVPGTAAAVLTHFFPFWSITGFTALWGSTAFAFGGLEALGAGGISPAVSGLIAAALFVCGFAFQLFVFRKQTVFKKIMPEKLRYRLEQKKLQKQKKGGSQVA